VASPRLTSRALAGLLTVATMVALAAPAGANGGPGGSGGSAGPLTFDQAKAAGTKVDWGPNCDTSTGKVAVPSG